MTIETRYLYRWIRATNAVLEIAFALALEAVKSIVTKQEWVGWIEQVRARALR